MAGYVAAVGGIFIFFLVLLSFGTYGSKQDRVSRRVSKVLKDEASNARFSEDELSKSLYVRLIEPFIKSLSLTVAKHIPKSSRFQSNAGRLRKDKLKKKLRQAGISMNAEEYSWLSAFLIVIIVFLFGLIAALLGLGSKAVIGMVFGLYTGYAALRLNLAFRISGRRSSMEQQMPDVLDLLSVNVEAGLGFEQSLLQVIEHFEGPLIEELTVTYREITMGRTRRDALMLFAERCELDEIKTFAGAIVQAEQLGISIKNVLRTQAAAMRAHRRSKIEEKAQKVQVKMLLPMVGLIFPVLLITLLGPAVVQILHALK